MRSQVFALFFVALTCTAGTISDPFHTSQSPCSSSYSTTWPFDGGCDVIGNEANYDIQKASIVISGNQATISLFLNTAALSKPSMTLGTFLDAGDNLIVGDVFFYSPDTVFDPSDPASANFLKYGVPIEDHDSLTPGALYKVGTTETAEQALNNAGGYYRRTNTVLMTSGVFASAGSGVTVADYGDGIANALYQVTVSFQTTADFMSLVKNGQIGLLFSAADCANDVIFGTPDVGTPEPRSLALIVGGLGLVGFLAVRRRRAIRAV